MFGMGVAKGQDRTQSQIPYQESVADFTCLGSKITADGDSSHEKKLRRLLLGRKTMTNLDSILKAETLLC